MKCYDVVCPICGKVNKNLFLDVTDGWMVCDKCGSEVGIVKYMRTVDIPKYNISQAERTNDNLKRCFKKIDLSRERKVI